MSFLCSKTLFSETIKKKPFCYFFRQSYFGKKGRWDAMLCIFWNMYSISTLESFDWFWRIVVDIRITADVWWDYRLGTNPFRPTTHGKSNKALNLSLAPYVDINVLNSYSVWFCPFRCGFAERLRCRLQQVVWGRPIWGNSGRVRSKYGVNLKFIPRSDQIFLRVKENDWLSRITKTFIYTAHIKSGGCKNAIKLFHRIMFADRLRTIRWSYISHTTCVVNQYGINLAPFMICKKVTSTRLLCVHCRRYGWNKS